MNGEMIGVSITIICVAMLGIVALAKSISMAIHSIKSKKKRRTSDKLDNKPSPPRKHVMTRVERDVHIALLRAKEKEER